MSAPPDSPVHSNIDARFPQAMERAARVRLPLGYHAELVGLCAKCADRVSSRQVG